MVLAVSLRRLILVAIGLVATGSARAGTLVLNSDRPVVITVNAVPYTVSGSQKVTFAEDKAGSKTLQVLNLLGQVQYRGSVTVPAEGTVSVRWFDGKFTVTNRTSSSRNTGPTPTIVAPDEDLPDDFTGLIGTDPPPAQPPPEDAEPSTDPDTEPSTAPETEEPDGTPAPGAAAPTGDATTGTLLLVSRSTSWINIAIDGNTIEFRGQPQHELVLAPGPHRVEVTDFNGKTTWFTGSVNVVAGTATELQFDRNAPPLAIDAPERYVEDE